MIIIEILLDLVIHHILLPTHHDGYGSRRGGRKRKSHCWILLALDSLGSEMDLPTSCVLHVGIVQTSDGLTLPPFSIHLSHDFAES